jgi:hypothetical protein
MEKTITYKHKDNLIDPRDNHLVTINKEEKFIITEASDLECANIQPELHTGALGTDWYIWMYSPKADFNVPFKHLKEKIIFGDKVADIFVPYFPSIWNKKQSIARELLQGWELHILND